MPPLYSAPADAALRQGELLSGLPEYRVAGSENESGQLAFEKYEHPWVVVFSPDCDLEQDYRVRFPLDGESDQPDFSQKKDRRTLYQVQVCPAVARDEIRVQVAPGQKIWERVEGNQDIRYHKLLAGPIGDQGIALPDLYIDFMRSFSMPTVGLYSAISAGIATRVAVIPVIYVHALIQRFFAYQSRIGEPDDSLPALERRH